MIARGLEKKKALSLQMESTMRLNVPAVLAGDRIALPRASGFTLGRLGPSDYADLRNFRAEIVESIGNPDVIRLMPDEEQYVHECLDEKNFAVGLFDNKQLVAFNSLLWPSTDDELRELHIYEFVRSRALASTIAYAGGVMVHPSLRGRGFQKLLIEVRMVVTAHVGRPHHFSVVSFANVFSWRNILEMGGRVVGLFEFTDARYGDTSRLFTHQSPAPKPLSDHTIWVDSLDIEAQRRLLTDGLVGTEFRMLGAMAQLGYRHEIG